MSDGPLHGAGVLVTRPAGSNEALRSLIERAGGAALELPVLTIEARELEDIRGDLARLPAPDLAIFVSANAVECGLPAIDVSTVTVLAIGPATRAALERAGHPADVVPEDGFDSEALLRTAALNDVDGRHVLIVRGQGGRELLGATLRARGATVDYLAVYRRSPATPSLTAIAEVRSWLVRGALNFAVAMSVESFAALASMLPEIVSGSGNRPSVVTPSRRVIQTAREQAPDVRTLLAEGPQAAQIVEAIVRDCRR